MHPTLSLQRGLLKRSSYYNPDYRTGAALLRARRPYLVKNALSGVVIFGFAIGVFVFTIKAVGQETFDDVVVPSEPQTTQQAIKAHNQSTGGTGKLPTGDVNGMRS